jgi:hypothetical protein
MTRREASMTGLATVATVTSTAILSGCSNATTVMTMVVRGVGRRRGVVTAAAAAAVGSHIKGVSALGLHEWWWKWGLLHHGRRRGEDD